MKTRRATIVVVLACVFALPACGDSSDSNSGAGAFDGVWAGTLVDTASPSPIRIELEQRQGGASLHGVVRLFGGDAIHHARLTGTASANTVEWTARFAGGVGTVHVRGQGGREGMTLSYDTNGTTLAGGTGTLSFAEPGGTNYAGAWVLSWPVQLPEISVAGRFCVIVVNQDGTNVVANFFNGQVPDGSVIITEGSVVGDTLAYT